MDFVLLTRPHDSCGASYALWSVYYKFHQDTESIVIVLRCI